jgi:hypothetical protein
MTDKSAALWQTQIELQIEHDDGHVTIRDGQRGCGALQDDRNGHGRLP